MLHFLITKWLRLFVISAVFLAGTICIGNADRNDERDEDKRNLWFDHDALTFDEDTLSLIDSPSEMTTGILGDFINLDTGELGFRQTDIDIPGNFDLPVRVTRIIDSNVDRPTFTRSQIINNTLSGTANWGLELPYLLLESIDSRETEGCIRRKTEDNLFISENLFVQPRISVPGNSRVLLKTKKLKKIFSRKSPRFTNSEFWRIDSEKKDGKCTWTAVATNGVIYEFDQVFILENDNGKRKQAMLVTKVTDIHKNYVTYEYDPVHRTLRSITGSDGRKILFHYNDKSKGRELKRIETKDGKQTWLYEYKMKPGSTTEKFLAKASLKVSSDKNLKHFWQFDQMAGVYDFNHSKDDSSYRARRCAFGRDATVRSPSGLVGKFKTKKIVNFQQANSARATNRTSHRVVCLFGSDTDTVSDGTSKFGNFSTFFTSAVIEKRLTDVNGETTIWKYEYDEGDLFNDDPSVKTVHRNVNEPKIVDITKPKSRTVTGPLGAKYVVEIGRSLDDTGVLVSETIYPKGSTTLSRKISYEYKHSSKRIGSAKNRERLNRNAVERWTRVSKRTWIQDGVTYTKESEYNVFGSVTKTTEYSTLKADKMVTEYEYLDIKAKWILGLPIKKVVNGLVVWGAEYDGNGKMILEKRFGADFERKMWNSDGTLAKITNGKQDVRKFENYKRSIAQKVTDLNGAVSKKIVDKNGWITQTTDSNGYTEEYEFNEMGWVTKITRPDGYADTTINFTSPVGKSGYVEVATIGEGLGKKIVTRKFDGFDRTILLKTNNSGNTASIFEKFSFDKLGRKIFESWKSSSESASAGIETKFDVLGRTVQKRESVSPFAVKNFTYLTKNRVKETDETGIATIRQFSGFGSPYDGKLTLIEHPNGLKSNRIYDKWLNLIEIQDKSTGNILRRTFKYDSRHQLCMLTFPEIGAIKYTYDEIGLRNSVEWGLKSSSSCDKPVNVDIATEGSLPESTCSGPNVCSHFVCPLNTEWRVGGCQFILNNKKILVGHNKLGQTVSVDFPGTALDIKRSYDSAGNETKFTQGSIVNEYTYGKRHELLTEKITFNKDTSLSASYVYDDTGGLKSYTTADGQVIEYTLDYLDQPTAIKIGSKFVVSDATYHPNGDIKSAKLRTLTSKDKDVLVFSNELNERMLITETELKRDKEVIFSYVLQYFKDRRAKSIKEKGNTEQGKSNRNFTFDSMKQLTSASNFHRSETYTFDLIANISSKGYQLKNVDQLDIVSGETIEIGRRVDLKYSRLTNLISDITFKVTTLEGSTNSRKINITSPKFSYDSKSRLSNNWGNIEISFDNFDRINDVNIDSSSPEFVPGFNTSGQSAYDGNESRAFFSETVHGVGYFWETLVSRNGELLFQTTYRPDGAGAHPIRRLASVNLSSTASFNLENCTYWTFQIGYNNTVYVLSENNLLAQSSSLGPFGTSWGKPIAKRPPCNSTEASNDQSFSQVSAVGGKSHGDLANNSNQLNLKANAFNEPAFRNSFKDSLTGFFYLKPGRYFDPATGRNITPRRFLDLPDSILAEDVLNQYVFRNNDPVNYDLDRNRPKSDFKDYRKVESFAR